MPDPMTANPNPFAALLAGVYVYEDGSVDYEAVLAALAAAVSDDLAEAGKVLAKLQSQIGDDVQDVYPPGALHKLSADTIAALLARIAAQEAQIKGLEAENRDMVSLSLMLTDANNRAEAAETALAAERAKVAKLVEALNTIDALDPEGRIGDCSVNAISGLVLRMGEIARAAITEASQ